MKPYYSIIIILILGISSCKSKKINAYEKRGHIVLEDSTLSNTAIHHLIEPYKDSLSSIMSEVITHSDTAMKRIKTEPETLLGNFVADLVYDYGKKQDASKVDFCLLNFGGLRNSLPKGDINVRHVFQLMPFENSLVNITISYDSLKSLTSYLAKQGGQPLANAKIMIKDSVCQEFSIASEIITSSYTKKTFTIITSDYLANGGDHMVFFLNPIKRESLHIKLRDAILIHCRANDPIKAQIEGRVIQLK